MNGRGRAAAGRPGRRAWPVLLLTCYALLGPAAAVAGPCEPQAGPEYRVDVTIEVPPVGIHRDLSRAELGEMAYHGPTDRILGLTASRLEPRASAHFRSQPLGDGYCIWVEAVHVVLRYSALDIYIASEYEPTSCPYQAILAHEKRHEKVARHDLKGYVQVIRSALSSLSIPKARSPLYVESEEAGKAKTRRILKTLLAPIHEKMSATMDQAQARVDSVEEYRKVRTQCRHW